MAIWIATSEQVCVAAIYKCGSQSIRECLGYLPQMWISPETAATFDTRIMFIRNPYDRLQSLWQHAYWSFLGLSKFSVFPEGTVKALGYRIACGAGFNDYRIPEEKQLEVDSKRVELETTLGVSVAIGAEVIVDNQPVDVRAQLDQEDYVRFIDYILDSNTSDELYDPQVSQATLNGVFIPNVVHKFEDINTLWTNYFGGMMQRINFSAPVPVDTSYRIADIETKYADDIALWSSL